MTQLTHVQKLVLDRILSLKRPQTSKDIGKHFAISPSTANHYIRALMAHGLVDVHKKVQNVYYYGRPLTGEEPAETKQQLKRKALIRVERTQYTSKAARQRKDSNILQDVWASVVRS